MRWCWVCTSSGRLILQEYVSLIALSAQEGLFYRGRNRHWATASLQHRTLSFQMPEHPLAPSAAFLLLFGCFNMSWAKAKGKNRDLLLLWKKPRAIRKIQILGVTCDPKIWVKPFILAFNYCFGLWGLFPVYSEWNRQFSLISVAFILCAFLFVNGNVFKWPNEWAIKWLHERSKQYMAKQIINALTAALLGSFCNSVTWDGASSRSKYYNYAPISDGSFAIL